MLCSWLWAQPQHSGPCSPRLPRSPGSVQSQRSQGQGQGLAGQLSSNTHCLAVGSLLAPCPFQQEEEAEELQPCGTNINNPKSSRICEATHRGSGWVLTSSLVHCVPRGRRPYSFDLACNGAPLKCPARLHQTSREPAEQDDLGGTGPFPWVTMVQQHFCLEPWLSVSRGVRSCTKQTRRRTSFGYPRSHR